MAAPITWRNVDTPNPAAAAPLLGQAQQSINGAFDQFSKILAQRQAVDNNNVAVGQDVLKQNFLDKLASAKSPEELAQLQSSGALDSLRDGLGAQARAAVRGADEARLNSLREGVTTANKFSDSVRDRAELPVIDDFNQKVAAKDFAGAQSIIDNSALHLKGTLQGNLVKAQRDNLLQVRGDEDYRLGHDTSVMNNTEAHRVADEAARVRKFDDATNEAIRAYREKTGAANDGVAGQVDAFELSKPVDATGNPIKIPFNSDGTVAADRMTSDTYNQFDTFLKKAGAPGLSSITSGDTAAYTDSVAKLRALGAKETDIQRSSPLLVAGLNSTYTPPIGKEATAIDRNQKIQEFNAKMDAALYVPTTLPGAASDAKKVAYDEIDKRIKPGWENDNWKAEIAKLYDGGGIIANDQYGNAIKDANGRPIRVVPGPDAVRDLLVKVNRGTIGWGAGDLRSAIDDWQKDGGHVQGAANTVQNQLVNAVKNLDAKR